MAFVVLMKALNNVTRPFYSALRPSLIETFGPQIITVELSSRCNLRCEMCEVLQWKEKPKDVSFREFKLIFSKLPLFPHRMFPEKLIFYLSGIGEILLNKDVFKIIRFLKGKGCFVTFADNFTLLNPQKAKELIESGADEIFLSLDGATKKTFESIRKGASFEKVLSNAKALADLKKSMHSEKPRIIARFVVSKKNLGEMPLLVKIAAKNGLKEIAFSEIIISQKTLSLKADVKEFEKRKKKCLALAEKLGVKVFFPGKKQPVKECNRFANEVFINPNGFVMPCHAFTQGGKYSESIAKYSFGNVFEKSLFSIWNSKKYQQFRQDIRNGKIPLLCAECQWFGKE